MAAWDAPAQAQLPLSCARLTCLCVDDSRARSLKRAALIVACRSRHNRYGVQVYLSVDILTRSPNPHPHDLSRVWVNGCLPGRWIKGRVRVSPLLPVISSPPSYRRSQREHLRVPVDADPADPATNSRSPSVASSAAAACFLGPRFTIPAITWHTRITVRCSSSSKPSPSAAGTVSCARPLVAIGSTAPSRMMPPTAPPACEAPAALQSCVAPLRA